MARKQTKTQETDLGFPNNDVILVVEGQKIHVNKAVLSEHSPVFNVMFKSKFKESTAKEIVLHDKKAVDVVEFLRSFYPNMKHPITGKERIQNSKFGILMSFAIFFSGLTLKTDIR